MFRECFRRIFLSKTNIDGEEYEISFAEPVERLSAFIVDFLITLIITVFILYPIIKKEIDKALSSYTSSEINVEFSEQGKNTEKENENSENTTLNIENKPDNAGVKDDINKLLDDENILKTQFINGQEVDIKKVSGSPTDLEKQEIIRQTLLKNKAFIYLILLIPIFYNVAFLLSKKQATIGQQVFKLKVIRRNGKKISFFTALDRVLLFTFSKNILISPFSIVLPILITKERTTAYDLFSGTRVIRVKNKVVKNNESNNNNVG